MAISTFSELQSSILTYATRFDPNFTNFNRVTDFITEFESWANRRFRVRQMEAAVTGTPTSGVASLPTDFLEMRCLTWAGSPRRVLEYVTPQMFDAMDPDRPSDTPIRYTIQGTSLKVMPLSDTTLELDYYQKIPALSDSNTTNWLLTAHPDLYLAGCLFNAFKFSSAKDAAGTFKAERDELAEEILRLDRDAQWGRGPLSIRSVGPVV